MRHPSTPDCRRNSTASNDDELLLFRNPSNCLDAGAENRLHDTTMNARRTRRPRPSPINDYIAAQAKIHDLLAKIATLAPAHQDCRDPEEITWGAVNDLLTVVERLEQTRSFLANEG